MRIVPRDEWGFEGPLGPAMSIPADGVWLHHSVTFPTNDPFADMRYLEEIGQRRFGRLSYSWAVHPDGTIMEGQGNHIGAHTAQQNSTSHGIVIIGDYRTETPTPESLISYSWLLGELEAKGWNNNNFLKGHKDNPHSSTSCPGAMLYAEIDNIKEGTHMTDVGSRTGVDPIFETVWQEMRDAGVFSEHTNPDDKPRMEELAAFLSRYTAKVVKKLVAEAIANVDVSATDDHARSLATQALNKIAAAKKAL